MNSERPVRPSLTLAELNAKNRQLWSGAVDSAKDARPPQLGQIRRVDWDGPSRVRIERAQGNTVAMRRVDASGKPRYGEEDFIEVSPEVFNKLALDSVMDEGQKQPKEAVDYSEGKGNDRCQRCQHFLPGDGPMGQCQLVEGPIDPEGWCKLFEPKGTDDALPSSYKADAEESLFTPGHYRAKVIGPQGRLAYLSQQSWPTEAEAVRAAQRYIDEKIATGNYDSAKDDAMSFKDKVDRFRRHLKTLGIKYIEQPDNSFGVEARNPDEQRAVENIVRRLHDTPAPWSGKKYGLVVRFTSDPPGG